MLIHQTKYAQKNIPQNILKISQILYPIFSVSSSNKYTIPYGPRML